MSELEFKSGDLVKFSIHCSFAFGEILEVNTNKKHTVYLIRSILDGMQYLKDEKSFLKISSTEEILEYILGK
ncbi:Uncharacterised protein [uncultured archaeon]|nr:Uncharacterised protein [uncultured archaeon]